MLVRDRIILRALRRLCLVLGDHIVLMPHPIGDDVALRRRILSYLGEQTLPRIVSLTMPIVAPDDRRQPQLVASGVVLEIGPARILISATHVAEQWVGLSINIADEMVLIRGRKLVIHTNDAGPGSEDDKLDTLLVRLDDDLGNRVKAANVSLISDVDLSTPEIGRDPYLLVGYPCSRNRDGLDGDEFTAQAYSLLTHEGDTGLYSALSADSASQLVLPFDKKDVWAMDKQVSAPDLNGISGGGVWRIPIRDSTAVRESRLSAIAVEWHRKGRHKHILCTRVRTILSALYHHYSDLRQPLDDALRSAVV